MPEAKVIIAGPIVADSSEAGNAWPYCTLEDVQAQLEYQKPYDTVRVNINSPGGRVDKGMGIYDWLRSLPNVTIITEAIGQCSSIATAVFLAGSERIIHPHTESLVHLPTGGINGATAEQAQTWAAEMARCEADLLALYAERAGVDPTTFTDIMRAETTLTAQQMLDYGFATRIVQPTTALAIMPSTASTSANADQAPGWAKHLMSMFNQGIAAMTAAMKRPATAQAPEKEATTALDVTTDAGAVLTIDTGDRDTYAVDDTVSDSDGNPAADKDYLLSDGNTITVVDGAITVITPPATDVQASAGETAVALNKVIEAVTALAGKVNGLENKLAATAKVANRVAATAGSSATAPRAAAPGGDKEADTDPTKTAGEKRAARRQARFAKA